VQPENLFFEGCNMIVIGVISTKGGVGKTTIAANLGACLAHIGFRVLMIDSDVQPSLSKYFPISHSAPNGLSKVIRDCVITEDEISQITIPGMDLAHGERPVLNLIYSDSPEGEIQGWLGQRGDRLLRLKYPIHQSQHMADAAYDFVIIDTQGAVGALQDASAIAGSVLISPVVPETLSAREFLAGTSELINRLSRSAMMMSIELGAIRGLIYRQNRTVDSKSITREIREQFVKLGGKVDALQTVFPMAKAYTEASTRRLPVHLHDPKPTGASASGYELVHRLIYELVPHVRDHQLVAPVPGADLSWMETLYTQSEGV
jgi:chromosome partitioning related protein ParA